MPKINIFIKLTALIFIVIAVAGIIVFSVKDKIEASAKKIYEKQNMIMAIDMRERNMSRMKADYEIVKQKLPVLKKMFPEEKKINLIIDLLEALAAQTNNIQVLNFSPLNQGEKMEAVKSVTFNATLTGNIGSFISYFQGLKKLPYLIDVDNVSISNGSGITGNNSQLNFTAKVFINK